MRKQDLLISLIHSLSQGERKFFIQSSNAQAGSKSYLKLYEALCRCKVYDTDELSKALGKSKADLANEKKYLEKNLLVSLRLYHDSNPRISLLNKLQETILLLERGATEYANIKANQTIEDAHVLGELPFEWYAHGIMLTLGSEPVSSLVDAAQRSRFHLKQMKLCAKDILLLSEFEELSFTIYAKYEKRYKDITKAHRMETQKLLKHLLLKANYANAAFQFYKYNLLAILYSRIHDNKRYLETTRRWVVLYEQQPRIDTYGYWTALSALTNALIANGNPIEFDRWLDKLKSKYYHQLPVDAKQLDKLLDAYHVYFMAAGYYKMFLKGSITLQKAGRFTENFIRNFEVFKNTLITTHLATTVFHVTGLCLLQSKTGECIDLLNWLFNETNHTPPTEYRKAKMLYLMAQIEWHKFKLPYGLVRSTVNYLKKTKQYGKAEQAILTHFLLLSDEHNPSEKLAWLNVLRNLVDTLNKNPETRMSIELLPYRNWIERNKKSSA